MATFSKSPRFPEQNHISGIPRPKSRVSKTVALVDEDESDYSLVLPRHLYAGCTPFKTEDVGHAKLFEPKDHRMGAQSGLKVYLQIFGEPLTNCTGGIGAL